MDFVTPGIGLIFWMCLVFSLLIVLLKKFAWKPILTALNERENSITEALKSAEHAREQMAKLNSDNEAMHKQAREERDQILKEAKEMKDNIISEAKKAAEDEGKRIILRATEEINKQKANAISELKGQVASLSVSIAEKLINNQLSNNTEQQSIIASQVNNLNSNQQAIA
ncbi:MAG: F0F1 ATP synthase subunit B [Bacteroidetes bacterium]|nr:F0F1 ATP synthase subunit B [Bacteroidota bacterium]